MGLNGQRPVFVIGTGGLAREMAQLLGQLGRADVFAGFITEDVEEVGRGLGLGPVAGDDAWLVGEGMPADIVMGIGHPAAKAKAVARYLAAGARFGFPNLVHPSALLDPAHVRLGQGNVVAAGCVFTIDIEVADFNLFNWGVTVGHDARIGSGTVLNPGAHISGGVLIADRVLVGTGASILEGRTVGADATVGAGAVVTRDVPPGATVIGVPARATGRDAV